MICIIKSLGSFLKLPAFLKISSFHKISSLLKFHPLFYSIFEVKDIFHSLPREIIEDILSRLPVKSILQLKCVSKSWRSLISDPSFHPSNNSINLLLVPNNRGSTYLVDSNTCQPIEKIDNLPLLSTCSSWDPWNSILDSCNGLLCINIEVRNEPTIFFLCNPYTRQCKKLPESSLKEIDLIGFGYNATSKDFFVVSFYCHESCMEAEIYSLAKNSWRVIQPMAYTFDAENAENRKGIFFNGVLHWVGTLCPTEESGCDLATTNYVIAFDTQSEEFRTVVQLPPDVPKGFCCIQLAVLDRRLSLVCNFDFEDVLKFEVWVMKDYGLKESWVKLYTITGFDHPYITNTGKFITNESYLYDPKGRNYREINVKGFDDTILNYTESLVLL